MKPDDTQRPTGAVPKLANTRRWAIVGVLGVLIAGVLLARAARREPTASSEASATATAAVAEKALPRLVDLGADRCVPCKLMMPVLDQLRRDFPTQLEVVFIDVWKDRAAGEKHGVNIIPTQIFFDATGRELFRHEGFFSREEILAKWRELGVSLTAPTP
jgi:thioredoxin 1